MFIFTEDIIFLFDSNIFNHRCFNCNISRN